VIGQGDDEAAGKLSCGRLMSTIFHHFVGALQHWIGFTLGCPQNAITGRSKIKQLKKTQFLARLFF
jgi:hypothetical protein